MACIGTSGYGSATPLTVTLAGVWTAPREKEFSPIR